jgi:hypothetical protein
MLALFPLVFIVLMMVIPLVAHVRNGFSHVDDAWTDEQRSAYHRSFDR